MTSEAEDLGRARSAGHGHRNNYRFYADPAEENIIGVECEEFFGLAFGLPLDREIRPEGDGGVDYIVHFKGEPTTIDIKGSKKPYHLPLKVEDAHHCADWLVLIEYINKQHKRIIGWCTREEILSSRIGYIGPVHCYLRPADQLRSLKSLCELREQCDEPWG